MKYLEAIKLLKEGGKVRQSTWKKGNYIYRDKLFFYYNNKEILITCIDHIEATNWEVLNDR